MTWRLRIEHTTRVRYSVPVLSSFNEARMTPLTLPTQTTLDARVAAGPGAPVWTYNDYWGSYVSVFDLPEAHDDLLIRAVAMVETEPFPGIPAAPDRPGWAELREQAPRGRLLEFLLLDRLFPRSVTRALAPAEACLADLSPSPGRAGLDDPARRVVGRLRHRLEYADPKQLPAQLAELLSTLQETCVQASEAIAKRYFQYQSPVAWERGG